MKKKLLMFGSYVLVAMLATVITLAMVGINPPSKLDRLEALIEDCFIGEADFQTMEDAAAAAMVKATGDRWSYYISAKDYDAHREQEENAYVGVGITIQQQEDDSGFLIAAVIDGGPAQEAGIAVNDLLIGVEEQDVRGMTTDQVGALVKGKEGTKVTLTVLRKGENLTLAVERRRIEQSVAEGELLDYLLPEGDLFRSVSYDGKEEVDTSDADFLDMPMAVLVNGNTYSAAEFFAAALMEYEAAVVVGEPTVGKGYYQQTIALGDGSAVALSTGKYYTPKGNSLADKGITPSVRVDVDEETASAIYYGTLQPADDPQIRAAIQALK